MGAGPLKNGAMTSFSRKKGVPTKIIMPKYTDRVFLRYRFGKYQGIPTEYQPKIPNRYTTLIMINMDSIFFHTSSTEWVVCPKPNLSAPAPDDQTWLFPSVLDLHRNFIGIEVLCVCRFKRIIEHYEQSVSNASLHLHLVIVMQCCPFPLMLLCSIVPFRRCHDVAERRCQWGWCHNLRADQSL